VARLARGPGRLVREVHRAADVAANLPDTRAADALGAIGRSRVAPENVEASMRRTNRGEVALLRTELEAERPQRDLSALRRAPARLQCEERAECEVLGIGAFRVDRLGQLFHGHPKAWSVPRSKSGLSALGSANCHVSVTGCTRGENGAG